MGWLLKDCAAAGAEAVENVPQTGKANIGASEILFLLFLTYQYNNKLNATDLTVVISDLINDL